MPSSSGRRDGRRGRPRPDAGDVSSDQRLEQARRTFAEQIRALAGVRSPLLVEALATVRREDFVGPGPWQILRLVEPFRGYEWTPAADPRHLSDNVLVALDASRNLNNGEPAGLLRWFDGLMIEIKVESKKKT